MTAPAAPSSEGFTELYEAYWYPRGVFPCGYDLDLPLGKLRPHCSRHSVSQNAPPTFSSSFCLSCASDHDDAAALLRPCCKARVLAPSCGCARRVRGSAGTNPQLEPGVGMPIPSWHTMPYSCRAMGEAVAGLSQSCRQITTTASPGKSLHRSHLFVHSHPVCPTDLILGFRG